MNYEKGNGGKLKICNEKEKSKIEKRQRGRRKENMKMEHRNKKIGRI